MNQTVTNEDTSGMVFWDVGRITKGEDAKKCISFAPLFLYNAMGGLKEITGEEYWFIEMIWLYWRRKASPKHVFRVWGKVPSEKVFAIGGIGDVGAVVKSLERKELLSVSGEVYNFTPLLHFMMRKVSPDEIEQIMEILRKAGE